MVGGLGPGVLWVSHDAPLAFDYFLIENITLFVSDCRRSALRASSSAVLFWIRIEKKREIKENTTAQTLRYLNQAGG